MSQEDLQKRIQQLEGELVRLKGSRPYSVKEDQYKGHPILVFEGPSLVKPLSLGLGKLTAIRECLQEVDVFLTKHKQKHANSTSDKASEIVADKESDTI